LASSTCGCAPPNTGVAFRPSTCTRLLLRP
jgi:hypothetical protein